jgi:MoaA/NifB/PqqE/SkfB family radical SAM enzyme
METTTVLLQKENTRQQEPESIVTKTTHRQLIISGFRMRLVHFKLKLSLIKIGMDCYRNPLDGIRSLRYLIALRRRFLGDNQLQKMVYAGGKYYMGLFTPGWNGTVYKEFITSQLHDYKPVSCGVVNRFNTVFLAITKKCALQCEHCYEWDNLNKKEVLTDQKLLSIVQKLQEKGASQIHLSGGEPLLKMDTLTHILEQAKKSTDFWILTSGFKLNATNAKRLKESGLTGAIISLDHFIPEKHNTFRHFKDAYFWVEEAVTNAKNNDLVTALSLCATRDFISEENLMAYMELAKRLKVSFVQILEPRAVGHYANEDVLLRVDDIKILEDFFLKMNFNKAYNAFPIITYHGYYQRRQGCYSAGIKGMYVDTDGDMNACPFCHKKTGNVLDACFENNLEAMRSEGCSSYKIKSD